MDSVLTAVDNDYAEVVRIAGLHPSMADHLVEHIVRCNEAGAGHRPVLPLAVARCAAALLAMDQGARLSIPTALAQAEALARLPEVGEALMKMYEGLIVLTGDRSQSLGEAGVHRGAVQSVLQYFLEEMTRLKRVLEQPEPSLAPR